MQSFNSAAGTSAFQRNGTTSPDQPHTPWSSGLLTLLGSGFDVNGLDYRLSDDLTFSQEFVQVIQPQCHLTVPTGCHSIPENYLPFHSNTTDIEQLYYLPEPQEFHPSIADDSLSQTCVSSQEDFPWFDPGKIPQSLPVLVSQPSMEPLQVMKAPQASSQSSGVYRVCDWIENDVQCGQTISGDILSTHLRNAHNIQGNEKRILVCRWYNCGQELQRGGMRRHVATRHLKLKSRCHHCFKPYSRRDAMKKHAKECQSSLDYPPSVVGKNRVTVYVRAILVQNVANIMMAARLPTARQSYLGTDILTLTPMDTVPLIQQSGNAVLPLLSAFIFYAKAGRLFPA
ncbi:hypothetical protein M405DRAFT_837176 [Rhizopogon salebrosus TDB-379]|nr:hypothetical protein M405DRAFT_837176 [Rhizopogon salebrosus TDB-379]